MGNDCFSLIRCLIPCNRLRDFNVHRSIFRVQRYCFSTIFAIPKNDYFSNHTFFWAY